jgi:hypothetical protein
MQSRALATGMHPGYWADHQGIISSQVRRHCIRPTSVVNCKDPAEAGSRNSRHP